MPRCCGTARQANWKLGNLCAPSWIHLSVTGRLVHSPLRKEPRTELPGPALRLPGRWRGSFRVLLLAECFAGEHDLLELTCLEESRRVAFSIGCVGPFYCFFSAVALRWKVCWPVWKPGKAHVQVGFVAVLPTERFPFWTLLGPLSRLVSAPSPRQSSRALPYASAFPKLRYGRLPEMAQRARPCGSPHVDPCPVCDFLVQESHRSPVVFLLVHRRPPPLVVTFGIQPQPFSRVGLGLLN